MRVTIQNEEVALHNFFVPGICKWVARHHVELCDGDLVLNYNYTIYYVL